MNQTIPKILKFKLLIMLIIMTTFAVLIDAPFSFRHYENPPFIMYFAFSFITSVLYISTCRKFIFAEKIFYSVFIGILALFCSAVLGEIILGKLYGFDDNFGTLKSPLILQNFAFSLLTNIFIISIFTIWDRYRKEIYN